MIVRDFQSVIGRETREQCLEQLGRLPDAVVACVGGGSNAAGMFYPFIEDAEVELVGAEAGGRGPKAGEHASSLTPGPARRAARQLQLRAAGRRRPDPGRPLDLGRPRLPGRRPRAQLLEGQRPRPLREHHRRRGPRGLQRHRPPRRHPPRPRVEPRPGPGLQGSPPPRARARSWSSASPAAATRTPTRSPGSAGSRSDRGDATRSRVQRSELDGLARRPTHRLAAHSPLALRDP